VCSVFVKTEQYGRESTSMPTLTPSRSYTRTPIRTHSYARMPRPPRVQAEVRLDFDRIESECAKAVSRTPAKKGVKGERGAKKEGQRRGVREKDAVSDEDCEVPPVGSPTFRSSRRAV